MRTSSAALVLLPLLFACSDPPLTVGPSNTITVSGTINIRNGTTLPADTRVVVLWGVSATSPDYSYVWGEGTINRANGTFTVALSSPPPAEALNEGKLGVALVLLTTDPGLTTGKVPDTYQFTGFVGASEDYSIIYTGQTDAQYSAQFPGAWPSRFNGYGVGQVQRSTTTYDAFTSVNAAAMVIAVDAMSNIHPPNWT